MKKVAYISPWLLLFLIFFMSESLGASSPKLAKLHAKVAEIQSVQQLIDDKIALGIKKRYELNLQISALEKEIKREMNGLQIDAYPMAIDLPRISYNIKLIQHLGAYVDAIGERIEYFQNGNELLKFFNRQIEDDLKLIKTLDDLEIEQLTQRINAVIREYGPQTQKRLICVDHIQLRSAQRVWQKISE